MLKELTHSVQQCVVSSLSLVILEKNDLVREIPPHLFYHTRDQRAKIMETWQQNNVKVSLSRLYVKVCYNNALFQIYTFTSICQFSISLI